MAELFSAKSDTSLKACEKTEVTQSCPTLTVAYQAPPAVGFPRQEYWSGLPFPSPILVKELSFSLGKKWESRVWSSPEAV